MTMTKQQILQELQEMVPLAVDVLRDMLADSRTPPAVRKQLIELALEYGVEGNCPDLREFRLVIIRIVW